MFKRGFLTSGDDFAKLTDDFLAMADHGVGPEELEWLLKHLAKPGINNNMYGRLYEVTVARHLIDTSPNPKQLLQDYWIRTTQGWTDMDGYDAVTNTVYEAKTSVEALLKRAADDPREGSAFIQKLVKYKLAGANKVVLACPDAAAQTKMNEIIDRAIGDGRLARAWAEHFCDFKQVAIRYHLPSAT